MSHRVLPPNLLDAIDAGACVLTLSQRSSHRLGVLLANRAVASGLSAWRTPDIQSFNAFALRLWRENTSSKERVLSAEQGRLIWERVVDESHWSRQLLSPQAAARSAYRSWELVNAWQLKADAIASAAEASDSDEARALLEWSERFATVCAEKGWLPAQCLPKRLIEMQLPRMHIITLNDDLVPAQRSLLSHMERNGSTWEKLSLTRSMGEARVIACPTPEAELQSAALWAQSELAKGSTSICIAVPQLNEQADEVRRIFAEVFAQPTRTLAPRSDELTSAPTDRDQQEASFAIAHYRSLSDFPLACTAIDLLKLTEGEVDSALVSGVLRSPFVGSQHVEQHGRALIDIDVRAHSRQHFDLTTLARLSTRCPTFLQQLHDAQALRLQWSTRALASAWAEHFLSLWRAFGWPGDQPFNSDEQQLLARFQEALGEFGALDDIVGPLSLHTAIRQFDQHLRNTRFEPRSRPAPITIIDPLQAEGLLFDAVWATGMDESRWPPGPQPDPFIPFALQVAVSMPNASAQLTREQARARFDALTSMASSVFMSYPCARDDVDVLPSAWLSAFPQAHSTNNDYASYANRIFQTRVQLESIDEPNAPAFLMAKAKGGSRLFELQAQCPFRAFAELRLGAVPLEEAGPEVDARTRGTLMHAALADIWNTLLDSNGLHMRTDAELQALVRTALGRHSGKLLDGASSHRVRMVQIEQDLAAERIMTLLTLDKRRSPFQIVGRAESAETHSIGPLRFELRLDRVDELLTGALSGSRVIIDYKTGNNVSATSWSSDRPEQPQLPLYAVTHPENLSAVSFVTLGAKGIAYKGEAREENILPGVKGYGEKHSTFDSWQGLLDHWRTVIERLAAEFAQGHAPIDPLPNACRYCHLSGLCRIAEQRGAAQDNIDEGTR